jgi:hypothetical protein
MDFVKELKPWSVPKIVEILGVPERTAYSWRMGDRLPPEWVQRLVIERMKRVKPDASE